MHAKRISPVCLSCLMYCRLTKMCCNLLLYFEGFEAIDPFIPIETVHYSKSEADSLYQYYLEKNWISSKNGKALYALFYTSFNSKRL